MKVRTKRLLLTALTLVSAGTAAALMVNRLRTAAVFYYAPSEIVAADAQTKGRTVRIGGLIKQGSLITEGLDSTFVLTDGGTDVQVRYHGVLPALFKEGQGTVATGTLSGDHLFVAQTLLAKHDENYMPPEAVQAYQGGKAVYAKPPYPAGAR